ncbi:sulfotransferase domain-containing protein [Ideonella sp. DXS29W]|uniref:Sulfotransferase domain-containing protein n=1 Tax=Ideonella lacteola TaxID=2984193 RepID=A0ABU9BL05_9BURK
MKISIKPPQNKKPVFGRPAFLLVGMMRSGSNFLERQLNLLPDVRCHGELFNPSFIGFSHQVATKIPGYARDNPAARNADEEAFTAAVDAACDRSVVGLRLFLDHSPAMTARLLYDANVKKIVLSRNLLEAYVSLETARETGVWLTTEAAKAPPKPVKVDINKLVTFSLRQSLYYNDVQTVLHQTGQSYLQVDYNEIKSLDKLNEIASFSGSKHRFAEVTEPIQKQNPGSLEERILDFPKLVEELKRRQLARWFR